MLSINHSLIYSCLLAMVNSYADAGIDRKVMNRTAKMIDIPFDESIFVHDIDAAHRKGGVVGIN